MNICNVLQRVSWEQMEEEKGEEEEGTRRNWETKGVNAGALSRTRSLNCVVVRGLLFWGLFLQPLSRPHLYRLYVRPTAASSECLFICSCGRRIDKRTKLRWKCDQLEGQHRIVPLCPSHMVTQASCVCVSVWVCLSVSSQPLKLISTYK